MDAFNVVAGACSILSLFITFFTLKNTNEIKKKIERNSESQISGDNNKQNSVVNTGDVSGSLNQAGRDQYNNSTINKSGK